MAIIPAGTPVEFRSRERSQQEVESLAVRLDPAFLRGIAEDADMYPVELVGVLGGRDPEIERIGSSLLSELENDGLFGDLFADSPATSLAVRLLRDHSPLGRRCAQGRTPRRRAFGGDAAAGHRLRRGEPRPQPHVGGAFGRGVHEPVPLSRTFKVSTGLSPHRYVIQRRVEKAKRLLVNTDLPRSRSPTCAASPTRATSRSTPDGSSGPLPGLYASRRRAELSRKRQKPTGNRKNVKDSSPRAFHTPPARANTEAKVP